MIWLSNTHYSDIPKIKRTFPYVKEGPPKAVAHYSVEDLSRLSIAGLYRDEEPAKAAS